MSIINNINIINLSPSERQANGKLACKHTIVPLLADHRKSK